MVRYRHERYWHGRACARYGMAKLGASVISGPDIKNSPPSVRMEPVSALAQAISWSLLQTQDSVSFVEFAILQNKWDRPPAKRISPFYMTHLFCRMQDSTK